MQPWEGVTPSVHCSSMRRRRPRFTKDTPARPQHITANMKYAVDPVLGPHCLAASRQLLRRAADAELRRLPASAVARARPAAQPPTPQVPQRVPGARGRGEGAR